MTVSAKSLILELLSAARGAPLTVATAIAAGALFEISENSLRVALARLSSEGLLAAAGRGAYTLTEDARALAEEVASWRQAEGRLSDWNGDYVVVYSAALGRTDKRALRQRTRALAILGLAELERGLHVRPENLQGGVSGVRTRLLALGLEPECTVFRASAFPAEVERRARGLWDGKALTASYLRSRQSIERWLERSTRLEPSTAARESFLLGGSAIRQLVYDPWLPAPLVSVEERHAFVLAVQRLDDAGRAIWRRFFQLATDERSRARAEI